MLEHHTTIGDESWRLFHLTMMDVAKDIGGREGYASTQIDLPTEIKA
jgi:hypothetical protein